MDHITDLPPLQANSITYDAILVVIDQLTKFVVFILVRKSDSTSELAYQLHHYVFAYFSLPNDITSDWGMTFITSVWMELLRLLCVRSSFSSVYHPQTNGQMECTNQTLEIFLHFYTTYNHDNWVILLPIAQLVLNNHPSTMMGVAPNIAFLSFVPCAHPLLLAVMPADTTDTQIAKCQAAIRQANAAVVAAINCRRSNVSFCRGDLVLLWTKHLCPNQPSHKLSNPLVGPFKVEQMVGERAYQLKLPPSWKVHPIFHIQMLEPYPNGARESPNAPQLRTLEDNYADYEVEAITDSQRCAS